MWARDSIFLALPDGKLMFMDGGCIASLGGRRTKTRLDIGEDVVSPYLCSRSIRSLDVVPLSHAHEDHIGGLAAILGNFHVKQLWTGATQESPEWERLRQRAVECGAGIVPLAEENQLQYGGAAFETLAPALDYIPDSIQCRAITTRWC